MAENKYGEVLVLIPARGGSKSVHRKNIIKLQGKPMIAWAIECALAAKHVSRVVVTTDDEEIAAVAREYGAEVPFMRPIELAEDFSTDVEFHQHALQWLNENEGYQPDMVVNLRPTPPSRKPEVIDGAIELFSQHPEADALRSVHLAGETPFKMWLLNDNGYMDPVSSLPGIKEPYNQPRQKLPLVYWQDGYVDITRPSVVLEKGSTTGDVIIPYMIEEPAVDIDYPDSIASAEAQLRERSTAVEISVGETKQIRHPS